MVGKSGCKCLHERSDYLTGCKKAQYVYLFFFFFSFFLFRFPGQCKFLHGHHKFRHILPVYHRLYTGLKSILMLSQLYLAI